MKTKRLRIALQKKGRLNDSSLQLLTRCGLNINFKQNALICQSTTLPIDLLFVRDDDIPTLVADNICDLGIVGDNVLQEKAYDNIDVIKKLGFGQCRLSIAIPKEQTLENLSDLSNQRIATSYPILLGRFLKTRNIEASIIPLSGSVEIAPRLNISEAICDLVSSGQTLEENNLKEVQAIFYSEAVLIQTKTPIDKSIRAVLDLLLRRINGVLQAQESKYILFHAPKDSISAIQDLLPGCEFPTILPLEGSIDKMAVHVVSKEGVFWQTLENLKQAGASSILVLPIEKMMQ